jgi:hypothetical protein
MSQHNDILELEIAGGIQDGLSPIRIVQRIQGILSAIEWDEVTIETVPYDCVNVARYMVTQKDGLYGVSHKQLHSFITDLKDECGLLN